MSKSITDIDSYISKSKDFAKPVLMHLRKLIHKACPNTEEKIKWSFPHFDYRGEMMCSMAAFKQHCTFSFWKATLLKDTEGVLDVTRSEAMGHLGRITSLKDLPDDDILIDLIHQAMELNEQGIKLQPKKTAAPKELLVPEILTDALNQNKKAKQTFDAFSYSHKKEYTEWINEAKTDATREKRLLQTIELLSEGKSKNWKYK